METCKYKRVSVLLVAIQERHRIHVIPHPCPQGGCIVLLQIVCNKHDIILYSNTMELEQFTTAMAAAQKEF